MDRLEEHASLEQNEIDSEPGKAQYFFDVKLTAGAVLGCLFCLQFKCQTRFVDGFAGVSLDTIYSSRYGIVAYVNYTNMPPSANFFIRRPVNLKLAP